jgi:D-sedoheptulose 7-phosphate isomerase
MQVEQVWRQSLEDAQSVLQMFLAEEANLRNCQKFSSIFIDCYLQGATVFSCGNGGSHCDSMHFAEEMTGRYRKDRRSLGALALGDASHVTCVSNDYGFQYVFSRQLEALARSGDVLLVLSTSGNSENLIRAVQSAKLKDLKTIALLGKGGGALKDLVDLAIVVPGETSDRIQEMHIKLIHIVIESVERRLFPENYV